MIPNWEFERNGKVIKITPKGPCDCLDRGNGIGAAIAGLGLIYTFEEYLSDALHSGELVPVLEPWWQSFTGPRLYYPSRTHMPAPLRAFVDFIKSPEERAAELEHSPHASPCIWRLAVA